MNYGLAEQEISDWLNVKFTEYNIADLYEASPIPENEREASIWYNKLEKARCTIEYQDSTYDPDTGIDVAKILERARFKISFESRKRRGPGGVYTIMELVKLFAIGFKPTNADRLVVVKSERHFIGENAIQLSIDLECKTLNIELNDPILSLPIEPDALYKQTEFIEDFDN